MTSEKAKAIIARAQAEVRRLNGLLSQSKSARNSFDQLFEIVASRVEHVVSELLQNADDAGATQAQISFTGKQFLFQHNGADFEESHFLALSSFSTSDKRTIKTTGFRGIGFKSTFSVGDAVDLLTPTFQVRYERSDFCYPRALENHAYDPDWTVTISIDAKPQVVEELTRVVEGWRRSPVSLLFFKNLSRDGLCINGDKLTTKSQGIRREIFRNGKKIWEGWLISKDQIELPPKAKEEISTKRGAQLDPSARHETQIDLLVESKERGRIYSVLPTSEHKRLGVDFAVNAAFVLQSDRDGIEAPSQSPTNEFLLRESGVLAAENLLRQLEDASALSDELKVAYQMLPLRSLLTGATAEAAATRIIVSSATKHLKDKKWLLSAAFEPVDPDSTNVFCLPEALFEIWNKAILQQMFVSDGILLHPEIPSNVTESLIASKQARLIPGSEILKRFCTGKIPRPESRKGLYTLWEWFQAELVRDKGSLSNGLFAWKNAQVIPVVGHDFLSSHIYVVRLSERTRQLLTQSNISCDELELRCLDQRYVATEKPLGGETKDIMLKSLGLDSDASIEKTLERVVQETTLKFSGSLLLSRIEAIWRLYVREGLELSYSLPILRRDGSMANARERSILLPAEKPNSWIPAWYIEQHTIHASWLEACGEISPADWLRKTGMADDFPILWTFSTDPMTAVEMFTHARDELGLSITGLQRNSSYTLVDYGFDERIQEHWRCIVSEDPAKRAELLLEIARHFPPERLESCTSVRLYLTYGGQNYAEHSIGRRAAAWLQIIASGNCLPDMDGKLRKPTELYISNAGTTGMILAGELELHSEYQRAIPQSVFITMGCRHAPPPIAELEQLVAAELKENKPKIRRVLELLLAIQQQANQAGASLPESLTGLLSRQASIPSSSDTLERPSLLVQDAEGRSDIPELHVQLRGGLIAQSLRIARTASREEDTQWICSLPIGEKLPAPSLDRVKRILRQTSSVTEEFFDRRGIWVGLDGCLRHVAEFKFVHKDSDVLRASNLRQVELCAVIMDLNVIKEPTEQMLKVAPLLQDAVHQSVVKTHSAREANADWIDAIAQVVWTEAASLQSEGRQRAESAALRLKTTSLFVDSGLSRRLTMDQTVIAGNLPVKVAWVDDELLVRAEDELEVCEFAEAIAHEITKDIEKLKCSDKLSSWIAKGDPETIRALANRLAGLEVLRAWPQKDYSPEGHADRNGKPGLSPEEAKVHDSDQSPNFDRGDSGIKGPRHEDTPADQESMDNDREFDPDEGVETDDGSVQEGSGNRNHSQSSKASSSNERRSHKRPTLEENDAWSQEEDRREDDAEDVDGAKPRPAGSKLRSLRQSAFRGRSYVINGVDLGKRRDRQRKAKEAGDLAEAHVLKEEKKEGRNAFLQPPNNRGFDIISVRRDGTDRRFIEVKSVAGFWGGQGVYLSAAQFEFARKNNSQFWLYVVECAATPSPIVHKIQDPVGHIVEFGFDSGWIQITRLAQKPPSAWIPSAGDRVIFDDEEVEVIKVDKIGAFHALTLKYSDGETVRKMSTTVERIIRPHA